MRIAGKVSLQHDICLNYFNELGMGMRTYFQHQLVITYAVVRPCNLLRLSMLHVVVGSRGHTT